MNCTKVQNQRTLLISLFSTGRNILKNGRCISCTFGPCLMSSKCLQIHWLASSFQGIGVTTEPFTHLPLESTDMTILSPFIILLFLQVDKCFLALLKGWLGQMRDKLDSQVIHFRQLQAGESCRALNFQEDIHQKSQTGSLSLCCCQEYRRQTSQDSKGQCNLTL